MMAWIIFEPSLRYYKCEFLQFLYPAPRHQDVLSPARYETISCFGYYRAVPGWLLGNKAKSGVISVTHSGTIAGNGFFNHILLSSDERVELPLLPTSNGLIHALSQPAWEICDVDADAVVSLHEPRWTPVQAEVNRRMVSHQQFPVYLGRNLSGKKRRRIPTADIFLYRECIDTDGHCVFSVPRGVALKTETLRRIRRTMIERVLVARNQTMSMFIRILDGQSFPKKAVRFAARNIRAVFVSVLWSTAWNIDRKLARESRRHRSALSVSPVTSLFAGPWIHISLGAIQSPPPASRRHHMKHVLLEHGTVRWSADAPLDSADAHARHLYAEQCKSADHLWVTNLDTRTLELAEEYASGRWSVLPHPYVIDQNCPYDSEPDTRSSLLAATDSEFLMLSASSMSLGGDQNKGTRKLIEAMSLLRREMGLPIGFLMVEWGTDITQVKDLCAASGLSRHIRFVKPMSRVRMQRTMAACDALADQFHYEAFGALSIRAWEQGIPVVSRRISRAACKLVGEPPPVHDASNAEQIARAVAALWEQQSVDGREKYILDHRNRSRSWLLRRHHHELTRSLQMARYTELVEGEPAPAEPGAWGLAPDWPK